MEEWKPLQFEAETDNNETEVYEGDDDAPGIFVHDLPCPCCSHIVKASELSAYDNAKDTSLQQIQAHLLQDHQLVVSDVERIADLHLYLAHWKKRFSSGECKLEDVCTTMKVDSNKNFLLLDPMVKEDQEIRAELRRNFLNNLIAYQQRVLAARLPSTVPPSTSTSSSTTTQNSDDSSNVEPPSRCLMCRANARTARSLFDHMYKLHAFRMGQPDNLVYHYTLLHTLRGELRALRCFFCEKTFPSFNVLRLHMKKKNHCRVSAENHTYDKFYLVNHTQDNNNSNNNNNNNITMASSADGSESTSHVLADSAIDEDDDFEWNDWSDDVSDHERIHCLYCVCVFDNTHTLLEHMKTVHCFDFEELSKQHSLEFYDVLKVLNFVRRKVFWKQCVVCAYTGKDVVDVVAHMHAEKHTTPVVGEGALWHDDTYLIPTYEQDALLRCVQLFDDMEGDEEEERNLRVLHEQAMAEKQQIEKRFTSDGIVLE